METAAMAAPRRMGSRLSQREERAGSAESWFTSSASLAPVAPEPPVSPGPVAEPPGKNLWEQICEGRQPGPAEGGGTRAAGRGPRARGAYYAPGG